MAGEVWPLVFVQEDNEVMEGRGVFLLAPSMAPFFCCNSHIIPLSGRGGESQQERREALAKEMVPMNEGESGKEAAMNISH